MSERRFFFRWIRATWAGWLLGIPCIVGLALVGEGIGIGGAQFIVGAGMGAGIGLLQGRAIRTVLKKSAPWFWSCTLGLAAPFLAWDIANLAGLNFAYFLYASVALGGVIIGIWQSVILRERFQRTRWWVIASVLGWSLSSGTTGIADWMFQSRAIQGLWGLFIYLGLIAVGGLILGIITGVSLVWMLRHDSPEETKHSIPFPALFLP